MGDHFIKQYGDSWILAETLLVAPVAFCACGWSGFSLAPFLHVLRSQDSFGRGARGCGTVHLIPLVLVNVWSSTCMPSSAYLKIPPSSLWSGRMCIWGKDLGYLNLTGRRFYGMEGEVIVCPFSLDRTQNPSPNRKIDSDQGHKPSRS